MANLRSQLVDTGIVDEDALRTAVADGGCVVANLVDGGADADAIVRHFEDSFGPAVGPVALAGAPYRLTRRLPQAMASAFCALPVVETSEFVVVAMADPSDAHARTEMERVLETRVEARPAKVGELRQALLRLASTHPKDSSSTQVEESREAEPLLLTKASSTLPATDESETMALPLTRTKSVRETKTRTFSRPSEDSWDAPPTKPIERAPTGDIGPVLAELRSAENRDHAIALACRGLVRVARKGVVLGLRRGVLRGWDGAGKNVNGDAIRNLWIPISSPSMFKVVVEARQPHQGNYGVSAADNLFRAAIGSRGGTLEVHPVSVRSSVVAVLCADDPGSDAGELIAVLAHALGEALGRLAAR